jgi:DNA helicase-2/ATP-dependent DNA helicase PcrA
VADFIKDLNEAQQKAVLHTDGASMVIAGAGSGKTRVLTYKVAYLIHQGIDPFNILALTFTNKAAREMKTRITNLVGAEAKNVWMGTFHSIFARVLRIEGHRLGYTSNYSIYDTEDSRKLLRTIIKEMNLDTKVYAPNFVHYKISISKNNLISPKEYLEDPEIQSADRMSGKPFIGQIYSAYNHRLKKADAMDFDDLLFNTYLLFEHFPELLHRYQYKFKYILVDEYQDTNIAQYMIIKRLAANNENICVVGDDAQSIYAFRGANIRNILNFRNDYPDHKVFKLEQNYRSTKNIVNAANEVIAFNKDQIFKKVWTDNDEGNRIKLIRAKTDTEEGTLVVQSIFETKMNERLSANSFAILYRTNAQSRSFEEALRKLNIPYRIFGGISFYQRKEIKDLLAYFRMTVNPIDEEALLRVINYPARGIGKTTIEKITAAAGEYDKSLWEIITDPSTYLLAVNAGTRRKLNEFATMIKSFATLEKSKDGYDLGRHIASASGILKDLYEDQSPEGLSRYENIEELLNAIKEYTEQESSFDEETGESQTRRLSSFLQEIALLTDADEKDKTEGEFVSLMTVHAAKGLEFPHIFVVGLEENLFPSIQSLNNRADLEEERRLFYVAVTRAEKQLTLSYAEHRYRWGDLTLCEPSRFLDEIDMKYLEMPHKVSIPVGYDSGKMSRQTQDPIILKKKNMKKIDPAKEASEAERSGFSRVSEIQPGMMVEHQKFGKGKVIHVEGYGGSQKATVFFQGVGQKNLLLKFARLKIVE